MIDIKRQNIAITYREQHIHHSELFKAKWGEKSVCLTFGCRLLVECLCCLQPNIDTGDHVIANAFFGKGQTAWFWLAEPD